MTITTIAVLIVLWSVFCFLCGMAFGRYDTDVAELYQCFCSEPSARSIKDGGSKRNSPADLMGQPRLRTDYSPSVDRQVSSDVADFIALRNRKVAENIGKDEYEHGHDG